MAKATEMLDVEVSRLKPYKRNAKLHSDEQVAKIMDSIRQFGFVSPILIDRNLNVIAGHGRIEAAKRLQMESLPCVYVEGLSEAQRKAYILADNRLTELGGWDMDLVREELQLLEEVDFDTSVIGFDITIEGDDGTAGSDSGNRTPGSNRDHTLMIDSMIIPMTNIEYQDLMTELEQYTRAYETNQGFVSKLLRHDQ